VIDAIQHRLDQTPDIMSFATAILVVSLFARGTMEELIDVTYFMADRQDATVSFIEKRPWDVVLQMARPRTHRHAEWRGPIRR